MYPTCLLADKLELNKFQVFHFVVTFMCVQFINTAIDSAPLQLSGFICIYSNRPKPVPLALLAYTGAHIIRLHHNTVELFPVVFTFDFN